MLKSFFILFRKRLQLLLVTKDFGFQSGKTTPIRALSTLRGLRGAPEVPPLCRETQSLGQQMLNAPVGINGLIYYSMWAAFVNKVNESTMFLCRSIKINLNTKYIIYI